MGRSFSDEEDVKQGAVRAAQLVASDGELIPVEEPSGPIASVAEAAEDQNAGLNPNNWRGISFDSRRRKWQSKVHFGGGSKYLGSYESAEEAARAYDVEARRHGRPLNFPEDAPALPQSRVRRAAAKVSSATVDVKTPPATEGERNAGVKASTSTAVGPSSSPKASSIASDGDARNPRSTVSGDAEDALLLALAGAAEAACTKSSRSSSRYIGVSLERPRGAAEGQGSEGRWRARIKIGAGQERRLGTFLTEEAAARAYDIEAKRLGRELNFPEDDNLPSDDSAPDPAQLAEEAAKSRRRRSKLVQNPGPPMGMGVKRGPAADADGAPPMAAPLPKRRHPAPAPAPSPSGAAASEPPLDPPSRPASRSRTPLCNLSLIAAAAGDDIGAYLRAVQPPIAEVDEIVALLTSERVGITMADLRMLRDSCDPDFQDATLRSADVTKGAWRVRLLYAIALLPDDPAETEQRQRHHYHQQQKQHAGGPLLAA